VPYVKCPSCSNVGFAAVRRRKLELCPVCGDPLGFPRTVVALSRGSQSDRAPRDVAHQPPVVAAVPKLSMPPALAAVAPTSGVASGYR
jgi:hypothetical protein